LLPEFQANSPGYASAEIKFGKTLSGTHDVTLELLPERSLRVTVLAPSGEPASGIQVRAFDLEGESLSIRRSSGISTSSVNTDEHGSAYLHGLPAAFLSISTKSHYTQPSTTLEVDLRSDAEHQATLQLDLHPFPSSGQRTVRVQLRFSDPEAQSALRRLDLHVFDDRQHALSHPRFELIEDEWTTTAPKPNWVQRVERKAEQLTVFVTVPKDFCRIQMEAPGQPPIWIDVPAELGNEPLTADL